MQLRRKVGGLGMPFAGDPDEAASALARYVRKVIGDDGASPSTISSSPGVYSHSTHISLVSLRLEGSSKKLNFSETCSFRIRYLT